MTNTNSTADVAEFQSWQLARTEAKLRDLAIDLRHAVERGDMTDTEANAQYERTAARWMAE